MTAHIIQSVTHDLITNYCGHEVSIPEHLQDRMALIPKDGLHLNPQASDCIPCRDQMVSLLPDKHPAIVLQH